ncbi:MAG: pectate lyase [Bacteroidota bacterium]|nr:pectate lyase [Bacteroidota bacterium]
MISAETNAARLLKTIILLLIAVTLHGISSAQTKSLKDDLSIIDPEPFADAAHHWYDIYDKNNIITATLHQPRYKNTDLAAVADNILLYQKDNGGWPKNYDIMAILTSQQKDSLVKAKHILNTTFDNGTSYTHVALLAQAYTVTHKAKYKEAALHGIDFILSAQYANGGWPQYYPLEDNYSRLITYNDGAFEGIMRLVKDMVDGQERYLFIDKKHLEKLKAAYARGLDCIIKTQINDTGKPTAWCQQYDEVTLEPAWARKFEPPSICNGESSDLVLFLMSIDHPQKDIVDAIQNAVEWFEESKILNTRVKVVQAPLLNTPYRVSTTDKVVVSDPQAPPIWTRYYELKTHRPLFCNRDSKVVYSLAEVDRERRDGYGWYTYGPQKVINQYPSWQKKWAPGKDVLQNR